MTGSPNPARTSPVKVQGMTPMTIDLADSNDSPSKSSRGSSNNNYRQAPAAAPVQYAGKLGMPETPTTASLSPPSAWSGAGAGSSNGGNAGLTPTGTRAHRALTASASPARVAELQQTLGLGSPIPVPPIPSPGASEGGDDREGPKAAFRRTYSSHSIKTRQVEVSPSSFQKIKLLGKGDVGKVYLVKEKKTDKLFAMKGMPDPRYRLCLRVC
jgi:protein-serine/threonine kinase